MPQPAHHIFHIDNGVVHHRTDGNDQTGQDHDIDRCAKVGKDDHGDDYGQRDDRGADQGNAPVPEEEDQHNHHQQRAEPERPQEVIERDFDESGGAEDGRVDVDASQAWPHLFDSRFHAFGHFDAVAPGEFFDDEQQARAIVNDGVANHRPGAAHQVGNVGHP